MTNHLENKITVPVLLVGFNRPDTTQQVFNRIRNAKPEKLYVAIDGPRKDKDGEQQLVEQVKEIVKKVDWPCQTHYRFSDVNKGAEVTVSSAISWVFEKEEFAIILEDDIVAPISFFIFMQEMLVRYKDDERIGIVSGNNFTPIDLGNDEDYFFAKYGHSWGWGTWRRTWKKFDLNIEVKDEHLQDDFLKTISNSKAEALVYKKRFTAMKNRGPGKTTWDFVANYIARVNNFVNIVPRVNLTSNIGIYGLHARGVSDYHFREFDENFQVKKHPSKVECNIEYDKHHFIEHYLKKRRSLYQRIVNKISRILTSKNYFK
jgi:hypothetical protein